MLRKLRRASPTRAGALRAAGGAAIPAAVALLACSAGDRKVAVDRPLWVEDTAPERAGDSPSLVQQPDSALNGLVETPEPTVRESDACVSEAARAALVRDAVDIMLVVDNSGSMSDELAALERSLNDDFAAVLAGGGTDYRLILVSNHRATEGGLQRAMCVEAPLSATPDCSRAPRPTFTEHFFQYSALVQSEDALPVFLDAFEPPFESGRTEDRFDLAPDGWSAWLRPGASRVIVAMTDNRSALSADAFLRGMRDIIPDSVDGEGEPTFVFHSVVGLRGKADPAEPYTADEDVETSTCDGLGLSGVDPGTTYQQLSQRSGGLRFSICNVESFAEVFRRIAGDVVLGAELSCDFEIPSPPNGRVLDRDRVAVKIRSEQGEATLGQVRGVEDCDDATFYLDAERVRLCPSACDGLRQDPLAGVDVLFACESQVILR